MISVHHLNNSRSQRVLWLLEELGVGYEVVRYERDPKTMLAPAALLAVQRRRAAYRRYGAGFLHRASAETALGLHGS